MNCLVVATFNDTLGGSITKPFVNTFASKAHRLGVSGTPPCHPLGVSVVNILNSTMGPRI